MSSKNTIIVVGLILGAVFVVLAVVFLRDAGLGDGTFDKGQRFKAKPGTTRENAMILTSNKRAKTQDPEDAIARREDQTEDSDPLEIKSLSEPEPDSKRSGPAGDTARAALNNVSPEAGLRSLDAALALPNTPAQAALLHEAKGQLHAQTAPPDYGKSLESFEEAARLAEDPDIKEEIVYKTVQMLLQAGLDEEAREQAEAQLAARPPEGETGYKLQIMQGQLQERAGRPEEAEKTYQAVLAAAQEMPDHLEKEAALSLARLAGLRLTALYRRNDRRQAAEVLSKDLKRQLARMEDL